MSFIGFILSLLISGLIVGALGRWVVPGPNPMSIGLTILIGIGGSFVGGLIAALIGGGIIIAIILEIAVAAGLVVLVSRRTAGRLSR
ncbi:MAG TPA: GlsB/YeaQ/YmgE family stress response membrane protein [Mycobacteriales bacterium]